MKELAELAIAQTDTVLPLFNPGMGQVVCTDSSYLDVLGGMERWGVTSTICFPFL